MIEAKCPVCDPVPRLETSKYCPEHADKLWLDIFAHYLVAFDLSGEQITSMKDKVGNYLERKRDGAGTKTG